MRRSFGGNKLNLNDTSWLKAVIFNSSSRLARQVACNIIELMCSSFERKREVKLLLANTTSRFFIFCMFKHH